ncbi:SDR family NAD(P)-dependent oxidoreductase [Nocardia uniformis]|uniref:SDR family NAD(P)-dependent oxidoreductase n=1 Tax=Nocardia uniformis TaxID=53432 RepID=A0A849CDF9_9NOCA|nr:SDR family NAD(P)-dependent oxidoreductase [Nocardia uniformis]NNH71121.1 SDR family NAD(P)-dependent oxidoreductase [Nocardia uniformis]
MNGIEPRDALVLITGAGHGIGAATARRYARSGATVVAVDIDEDAARATARDCGAQGVPAHARRCDVGDAEAVAELAKSVSEDIGEIDIVVNNAGVGVGGPFLDTSLDDWTWLRSVNLDGVIHGCHIFGAAMAERGRGQLVNIASGAGYLPNRRMATYCASKAAVIMFSRCLRADLRPRGVGVSVVCPGVINTGILDRTRLRGNALNERDWFARAFDHSHSPDTVAKAVVRAAAHDRSFVPVGAEVRLAHHLLRLTPGPIVDLAARI